MMNWLTVAVRDIFQYLTPPELDAVITASTSCSYIIGLEDKRTDLKRLKPDPNSPGPFERLVKITKSRKQKTVWKFFLIVLINLKLIVDHAVSTPFYLFRPFSIPTFKQRDLYCWCIRKTLLPTIRRWRRHQSFLRCLDFFPTLIPRDLLTFRLVSNYFDWIFFVDMNSQHRQRATWSNIIWPII